MRVIVASGARRWVVCVDAESSVSQLMQCAQAEYAALYSALCPDAAAVKVGGAQRCRCLALC
jgi:hypothetical protein